jgi:predicted RNase H-like HicB family nuclease
VESARCGAPLRRTTERACYAFRVRLNVELEREDDGRWIAEVVDLPGVLAYGHDPDTALRAAQALAFRVIADRIEQGELDAPANRVEFILSRPSTAA